jgi:hypothetical protein
MTARIAHLALFAGLSPLVPLPLLDGWVERRLTRAMLRRVLADAGRPVDDATLGILTEDRSGMLVGCLGVAVVWPLKKLFRTVLYFLTVKDVLDAVTRAALVAAMVHAAPPGLVADPKRLRDGMDATLARWNYSPLSRTVLRGDRPAATWVGEGGRVGAVVRWLYERGGGGAILADFQRRIEETE